MDYLSDCFSHLAKVAGQPNNCKCDNKTIFLKPKLFINTNSQKKKINFKVKQSH